MHDRDDRHPPAARRPSAGRRARTDDRPPDAAIAALSRQLAARFAPDARQEAESVGRPALGAEEPDAYSTARPLRPRAAALAAALLGIALVAAGGVFLLYGAERDRSVPAQPVPVGPMPVGPLPVVTSPPEGAARPPALAAPVPAQEVPAPEVPAKEIPAPAAPAEAAAPVEMPAGATNAPAGAPRNGVDAGPAADQQLAAGGIKEVQALLQTLGLDPGPVDGVAGRLTTTAIKRYEQSKGMTPSGRATQRLLKLLREDPKATARK